MQSELKTNLHTISVDAYNLVPWKNAYQKILINLKAEPKMWLMITFSVSGDL
jgi:hypothetical protein